MRAFILAWLPHVAAVLIGAAGGVITGLVFDVQVIAEGGIGPAAAHAGAFVLFLLAAVPAFLALIAGYCSLALSLVVMLVWDAARRRWPPRATVRLMTLLGGIWPWLDMMGTPPPNEGWSALHFAMFILISLVAATLGCFVGLVAVHFIPHPRKVAS